jgi:hypothetical protein
MAVTVVVYRGDGLIDRSSSRALSSSMVSKAQFPTEQSVEGEFVRQDDAFRDWLSADGSTCILRKYGYPPDTREGNPNRSRTGEVAVC